LAFARPRGIIVAPPGIQAMRRPAGLGDDMFDSTTTIIMLVLVVVIYMLPTLIAFGREHPRRQDVAVVNILLGWTLIGWVGVFLWALLTPVEEQPT
jgi:hypothetical protein